MDVDDPPAVGAEQHLREDAHVPRQTDQIDPRGIEPRDDLAFVVGLRGILLRREGEAGDAPRRRALRDARPGPVADDERHLGRDRTPLACSGDRLEVAPFAAGENSDPLHRHATG